MGVMRIGATISKPHSPGDGVDRCDTSFHPTRAGCMIVPLAARSRVAQVFPAVGILDIDSASAKCKACVEWYQAITLAGPKLAADGMLPALDTAQTDGRSTVYTNLHACRAAAT